MKLYKITKPHFAIDSHYDGTQYLSFRKGNYQDISWQPYFSLGAFWSECLCSSIDDCRMRIAAINNIKPDAVFISHAIEKDGYDVWTVDLEPRTTIDGEETFHNGLTWIANIEEA